MLSAKFLKIGANDFLNKPFTSEELFWRVNQNLTMLGYIASLKKAASEDHLTGLANRRHFFQVGAKLLENAKRHNLTLTVGMIDIDWFKKVNDRFGHAAGDRVLCHAAGVLTDSFRASDVICRFGGEEFCVLAVNMKEREVYFHFEQMRTRFEQARVPVAGHEIAYTVSMGVTQYLGDSLDETIQLADSLLYRAKEQGRNQVVVQ